VGGKEQLRLQGPDAAQRRDGHAGTLKADVGPLHTGQGPHLALTIKEVTDKGQETPVDFDEVAHRADRVPGRGDSKDLPGPVGPSFVLLHVSSHLDGNQQAEAVLAEVIVVVQRAPLPMLVNGNKEVALHWRYPDACPRTGRPGQALALVSMVVGHQDIGELRHSQIVEVVEHGARPEIDRDGAGPLAQQVNVARVPDTKHVRCHLEHRPRPITHSAHTPPVCAPVGTAKADRRP
jgi:hypothetical protein